MSQTGDSRFRRLPAESQQKAERAPNQSISEHERKGPPEEEMRRLRRSEIYPEMIRGAGAPSLPSKCFSAGNALSCTIAKAIKVLVTGTQGRFRKLRRKR